MNQPRIIRKYVNRRLYDTTESRYVNLDELRRLIADGAEIRVLERTSGRDITSTILLQIIEETQRNSPLLSPEFLCELIRLASQDNPDPALAPRLNSALRAAVRENRGQHLAAPPMPASH